MTVLSGETLRERQIFAPHRERTVHEESGTSGGLSLCGYDVSVREDIVLPPGGFVLASTVEHFDMPLDVVGVVHDKSTLARLGVAVQNTVAEPGWRGYLTLELTNGHAPWSLALSELRRVLSAEGFAREELLGRLEDEEASWNDSRTLRILAGQPIAQVLAHLLDRPVVAGYSGKYQNQESRPVSAIREKLEIGHAYQERPGETRTGSFDDALAQMIGDIRQMPDGERVLARWDEVRGTDWYENTRRSPRR